MVEKYFVMIATFRLLSVNLINWNLTNHTAVQIRKIVGFERLKCKVKVYRDAIRSR